MARRGQPKNLSGGLPLPDEVLDDYPRVCVAFQCPDEPEIVRSVLGHIWDLGRWDVWEKGGYGDTRATRMARQFKSILLDTLRIRECDEMSACCDNLLSEVRQIKALLAAIERRQAQDDATTIINNYTSYWNNPATVVDDQYPDAPDVTLEEKTGDTPQQQARRIDALCYLARVMVDTAYEAYRRDKADSSFLANLAIAASGMVLSVAMAFSKLTGWGLIMSLIIGLAQVGQNTKDHITNEDLADEDMKKTIQCKLRQALRNASPTATAIKAAVTTMPDGAAGRETRMTQAVRDVITNTDDTALQNSVKAALSEAMSPLTVVPSCPCPDESGVCVYQQPNWQNYAVFPFGFGTWTTLGAQSLPNVPSGYSAVVVSTDHGDTNATWRTIVVDTDMPPGMRQELRVSQSDVYTSWDILTEVSGPYGASFMFEYTSSSLASQTTQILLETLTGVFTVRRVRFFDATNMLNAECD